MIRLKRFTIAIDGPGGAGKSTVADELARRLGAPHLDTGAMYRAFGWKMLTEGLSVKEEKAVEALAERTQISVRFSGGAQHTLVNGKDVTALIRTPEISMAASDCGTLAGVRRRMVALQQEIASRQSIIMDGRDIGTRVLPRATLKVFLTAAPEVRARRRCEELNARSVPAEYDTVLREVIARDLQDTTRTIDPLRPAEDAVTLDTGSLTREQVVEQIYELAVRRLHGAPKENFNFLYRLAMAASWLVFHTVLPVRYHGLENLETDAPYILIANHNHMLDPFLIGWKIRRYQIRYLGKKELIRNPIARLLYRKMHMIPVGRHNTDMAAVRACLKTLQEKHVLGIFPEGTRYKTTMMEELESGVAMIALKGGVPLLPAYMNAKPRPFRPIDCYYGPLFSLADIAGKGINRETCEEALNRITALYRDMARANASAAERGKV